MSEQASKIYFHDIREGDWLHDGSAAAGYWGKITRRVVQETGMTERLDIDWYKWDPALEKPMYDYIHVNQLDYKLRNFDAWLRPTEAPANVLTDRALLLRFLPQQPARQMPKNPVMFRMSGFTVLHYNIA